MAGAQICEDRKATGRCPKISFSFQFARQSQEYEMLCEDKLVNVSTNCMRILFASQYLQTR
jgi:hypothetical protein